MQAKHGSDPSGALVQGVVKSYGLVRVQIEAVRHVRRDLQVRAPQSMGGCIETRCGRKFPAVGTLMQNWM